MDAFTAQDVAENLSEGINCLYAIEDLDSGESSASLSKMRDVVSLMQRGARFHSPEMNVDAKTIERLDAIIERLAAGQSLDGIREQARMYLADMLGAEGLKKLDDVAKDVTR